MDTNQAPDTAYPTITLAGKPYELRITIHDLIALEKQGVSLLMPTEYDKPGANGLFPSFIERYFKIIAQATHANLTPENVAEMIGLAGINAVAPAVTEAIKKVRAQIAGAEPAPTTEAPKPN